MEQSNVTTATPTTSAPDGATRPEIALILTGEDGDDAATEPASAVFSSIKQTAIALVTVASEQATQRTSRRSSGKGAVRDALAERHEVAIQRATADQARRAAERARIAFDALVDHTTQPCFAIDDTGTFIRWNPPMARWTGVDPGLALGASLTSLFSTETASQLQAANTALREAEEMPGGVDADPVFVLEGPFACTNGATAVRVSLLPLCRLPRIVEAVIVLVEPSPLTTA
jgi:PAS domain-containing protein